MDIRIGTPGNGRPDDNSLQGLGAMIGCVILVAVSLGFFVSEVDPTVKAAHAATDVTTTDLPKVRVIPAIFWGVATVLSFGALIMVHSKEVARTIERDTRGMSAEEKKKYLDDMRATQGLPFF